MAGLEDGNCQESAVILLVVPPGGTPSLYMSYLKYNTSSLIIICVNVRKCIPQLYHMRNIHKFCY